MKLTALLENTSISDTYKKKHGLSLYIETGGHKILFDVGPNDFFLHNAGKMGIPIEDIDSVVISHGHSDHGGGLETFLEHNKKAKIYIHKNAFDPHYAKALFIKLNIGLDASLKENSRFVFTGDSYQLSDGLTIFSDITGSEFLPASNKELLEQTGSGLRKDTFAHEQSLILAEGNKTVLISGCAHRGILNILKSAQHRSGKNMDYVISGFHLNSPGSFKKENESLFTNLAGELKKQQAKFYTCHCTGEKPFAHLKTLMGDQIEYLSTGSTIEL